MIKAVQTIGPQPQAIERKAKKGGGGIGQAIGAVAGGVVGGMAGSVVPGAGTAAGALAGASAGASLGAMAGNAISPAQAGSTAMVRRGEVAPAQMQGSDKSEQLKQSLMALRNQPSNIQKEYAPVLVDAYVTSVAQAHPKQGGGVA